jgi:hypothetical protein
MAVGAVAVVAAFPLAGCGGKSGSHGSAAPGDAAGSQTASAGAASTQSYDMQSVEGCFNAGGENTHEAPDYGWFDLINLGHQATSLGQGAFSTFAGSAFDNSAFYFFSSHDQAEVMVKNADLSAHGAKVKVVGSVIVARYSDLSPSKQSLQNRCLSG